MGVGHITYHCTKKYRDLIKHVYAPTDRIWVSAGYRRTDSHGLFLVQDMDAIESFVERFKKDHDIYIKLNPYDKERSIMERFVYADLDWGLPDTWHEEPLVLSRTSGGRYQAIWRIQESFEADMRDINKTYQSDSLKPKIDWLWHLPYTINQKRGGTIQCLQPQL